MNLSISTTNYFPPPTESACILGVTEISDDCSPSHGNWPHQRLLSPVLGDQGHAIDVWMLEATAALQSGITDEIVWRRNEELLFGVIEIDEAVLAPETSRTVLQVAAFVAYERVFSLLDAHGLPHLWRMWNYMADINGETNALERYRQFNMGRAEAFEACSRSVVGRVPAACALGVASGPLTVAFIAGATPITPLENPRQVSAFRYPNLYGPRSPTFSRAALAHPSGQEVLFVSGTASIVGHQTVHIGNVAAQTAESLHNIAAVLREASKQSRTGTFVLSDLGYRVYVRHAADLEVVRAVIHQKIGNVPAIFVQADICRADLLVEIEGQVIR